MGKCSNIFDQLLIYRKIQVSRNNLQVYKGQFLVCVFKLSNCFQIIYHSILINNCNNVSSEVLSSCIVITPGIILEEEGPYIT